MYKIGDQAGIDNSNLSAFVKLIFRFQDQILQTYLRDRDKIDGLNISIKWSIEEETK